MTHDEKVLVWRLSVVWWVLCYVFGLILVWAKLPHSEAAAVTAWASVMYALAIGIPMYLVKP